MRLAQPLRTEPIADLLVGRRREDQVACRLEALPRERRERNRTCGDLPLHVERAATPHLAIAQLTAERVCAPFRRIREHDVGVRQEEQGRPLPPPRNTRNEVGTFGNPRKQVHLRTAFLQVASKKLGRSGLVARRIRRVDADQLLQELRDLVAGRDRRHQRRVPRIIRYSRGASTRPLVIRES